MRKHVRRSGFTLPEILVTVTILAVLAAVVVPAVTQYVNKGNTPASQQDIDQVRNAITAFVADVRKYPQTLTQLTIPIKTTDKDITGTVYTATDSASWKGPYFSSTIDPTDGFTSHGLNLKLLAGLRDSASWIVDSIAAPASCIPVLALDTALDRGDGRATGAVVWSSAGLPCSQANPTGAIAGVFLRLTPAP